MSDETRAVPDRARLEEWMATQVLPDEDDAALWCCRVLYRPSYLHELVLLLKRDTSGLTLRVAVALASWSRHADALLKLQEGQSPPAAPPVYRATIQVEEEEFEGLKKLWRTSLYAAPGIAPAAVRTTRVTWWVHFEGEGVDQRSHTYPLSAGAEAAADLARGLLEFVVSKSGDPIIAERAGQTLDYLA
jgi:hypothetical protein